MGDREIPQEVARHYAYLAEKVIALFDMDVTAGSFLRDDGEGGFSAGIYRMAREIDRLRAENNTLRSALKPFAARGKHINPVQYVTLGSCQKAAAAYDASRDGYFVMRVSP